jgi:hypothetical protein
MSFAGSDLEEKLTGEDISGRELSLMQKEKDLPPPLFTFMHNHT